MATLSIATCLCMVMLWGCKPKATPGAKTTTDQSVGENRESTRDSGTGVEDVGLGLPLVGSCTLEGRKCEERYGTARNDFCIGEWAPNKPCAEYRKVGCRVVGVPVGSRKKRVEVTWREKDIEALKDRCRDPDSFTRKLYRKGTMKFDVVTSGQFTGPTAQDCYDDGMFRDGDGVVAKSQASLTAHKPICGVAAQSQADDNGRHDYELVILFKESDTGFRKSFSININDSCSFKTGRYKFSENNIFSHPDNYSICLRTSGSLGSFDVEKGSIWIKKIPKKNGGSIALAFEMQFKKEGRLKGSMSADF